MDIPSFQIRWKVKSENTYKTNTARQNLAKGSAPNPNPSPTRGKGEK